MLGSITNSHEGYYANDSDWSEVSYKILKTVKLQTLEHYRRQNLKCKKCNNMEDTLWWNDAEFQ